MKWNFLFLIALRNLKRRPRRTFFLIIGMALANALTIWILTFRESSFNTMMDNVLGMKYGNEQITRTDYYDFEKGSLNPFRYFRPPAIKLPPSLAPRTQATVLMATDVNAIPVILNGYDLETELRLSKLATLLSQGYRFKGERSLLLGERLAHALGAKVGDEIGVIGQAVDGSVANDIFTVELVLDLGGGEFEKNFAVTSLEDMQTFLALPPEHIHLLANFGDPVDVTTLPDHLEKTLWQDLLPEIASSSGFMEKFTRFYAVFFAVVASLAMGNTLALSFLERVREYRACIIIGASAHWLRRTMAIEIFLISGSSLLLGNIFILLAFVFFHYYPLSLSLLTGGAPLQMGGIVLTQDVEIRPESWIFLISNLFFIVSLSLASFYPMRVVLRKSQRL